MFPLLETIGILVALLAGAVALVVWRKLSSFNKQQNGIYEEISALAIANKRLIERIKSVEEKLAQKSTPVIEKRIPSRKIEPTETGTEQTKLEQKSLWQDVLFLAKQGLSADTIARDLNITRGEVELILGLESFKADKKTE